MKYVDLKDVILKSEVYMILDLLYHEIKHGDEEHQKWLKDKIEEFKQNLFKDE